MLGHDRDMIVQACRALSELALGGTAVGTGLNAPAGGGGRDALGSPSGRVVTEGD